MGLEKRDLREIEKMNYLNIDNIIRGYINVYLNPRTEVDVYYADDKWLFKSDYINLGCSEKSFYIFLKHEKLYSVSDIERIFFSELSRIGVRLGEEFYDMFNSLFKFFYLPLEQIQEKNSFVHRKAISFIQLAINDSGCIENDNIRLKYIRNIFYNSYLYDSLNLLEFRSGFLYFNNIRVLNYLLSLETKECSRIFKDILNYCLSVIYFIENGLIESKMLMLDDKYKIASHYTYFISKPSKPYKYKKLIKVLDSMLDYPECPKNEFINNMFLLNFLLLEKKAEVYIFKYIEDLDKQRIIKHKMDYLKYNYVNSRIFRINKSTLSF